MIDLILLNARRYYSRKVNAVKVHKFVFWDDVLVAVCVSSVGSSSIGELLKETTNTIRKRKRLTHFKMQLNAILRIERLFHFGSRCTEWVKCRMTGLTLSTLRTAGVRLLFAKYGKETFKTRASRAAGLFFFCLLTNLRTWRLADQIFPFFSQYLCALHSINHLKLCKGEGALRQREIDLFHNGGQINYSFVLMLISPTNLATTSKFQKKICFKTRAVGQINLNTKECKVGRHL